MAKRADTVLSLTGLEGAEANVGRELGGWRGSGRRLRRAPWSSATA